MLQLEGIVDGAKSTVIRSESFIPSFQKDVSLDQRIRSQIPDKVLDLMLSSYHNQVRYVKNATIEYSSPFDPKNTKDTNIEADISIPYTFYAKGARFKHVMGAIIKLAYPESKLFCNTGSGHFNLTESSWIFNQLGYLFMAERVRLGIAPELKMSSVQEFKDMQMGGCLIREYWFDFTKIINPHRFKAKLSIDKMKAMGDAAWYWLNTNFSDDSNGKAQATCKVYIKKGKG